MHERGDPRATSFAKPAFRLCHESSRDALAALVGGNDQSIEVPAPSVPTDDEGADNAAADRGGQECAASGGEEAAQTVGLVDDRAAWVAVGVPEREHGIEVGARCLSDLEGHAAE